MAKNAGSDTLRLMNSPAKSKKSGVKGSVRFSPKKIYSTERGDIGIKSHHQILQRHVAPHTSSGEQGSVARRHSYV